MTLAYESMPLFFLGHGEGRPFLLRTNLPASEAKAARHTIPDHGNASAIADASLSSGFLRYGTMETASLHDSPESGTLR
jgi:hypothetical protein